MMPTLTLSNIRSTPLVTEETSVKVRVVVLLFATNPNDCGSQRVEDPPRPVTATVCETRLLAPVKFTCRSCWVVAPKAPASKLIT